MAIVCIREGYSGQRAGGEVDKKTSVKRFSLVTDDPTDGPRFVWPQSDPVNSTIVIPAPGTLYPEWTDIRSKEPHVDKVSPCFFNVEVRYGSNVTSTGEEEEDEFAANPLSKPAEERWDSVSSIEPVSQDINGIPYKNLFGEFADRNREFLDEVLYLTRNEAAFNELDAHFWLDTVYDGTFREIARGRVLMKRIGIEHIKDEVIGSSTFGDILYSRVAYEIYFRHRNVPLINAYEVKKLGEDGVTFSAIADNEANQAKYAWYSRRPHSANYTYDKNGEEVKTSEEILIWTTGDDKGTKVPKDKIPDFLFQQEKRLKTWPGVA